MICPECGNEMFCPCETCKSRHGQEITWIWIDGEFIKCGHCGLTYHADKWLDIEMLEE